MKKIIFLFCIIGITLNLKGVNNNITINGDFTCSSNNTESGVSTYNINLDYKQGIYVVSKVYEWTINITGGRIVDAVTAFGQKSYSNNNQTVVITPSVLEGTDLGLKLTVEWDDISDVSIDVSCRYWKKQQLLGEYRDRSENYVAFHVGKPSAPAVIAPIQDIYVIGTTNIKLKSSVPGALSYTYTVLNGALGGTTEKVQTIPSTSISYKANSSYVGWETVYAIAKNNCGSVSAVPQRFFINRAASNDPVSGDVIINGPNEANPGQSCTWSVNMQMGQAPFSYNWSYKTSTSSSYKPMGVGQSIGWGMPSSTHLYLQVKITDANGNITYRSYTVWNTALGGNPMKSASIQEFTTNTQNSSNTTSELSKKEGITNLEQNFSVFPNPSSGSFNLTSDIDSEYDVNIYNNLGAVVWSKKLNGFKSAIDISNQPKGVYLIKVNHGDKIITHKILKN